MSILFLLIPLSVLFAAGFLGAFIWAVRSGQYEDTCTPALRLLMHDTPSWRPGPNAESGSEGMDAKANPAAPANGVALPARSACQDGPPSADSKCV